MTTLAFDPLALDIDTARAGSLIVLVVLGLLAVAVVVLVARFAAKFTLVAVLAVLAVVVWNQRADLADCPRTCSCSFLGMELEIGADPVDAACRDLVSEVREIVR